jgi:hypothetical protein
MIDGLTREVARQACNSQEEGMQAGRIASINVSGTR